MNPLTAVQTSRRYLSITPLLQSFSKLRFKTTWLLSLFRGKNALNHLFALTLTLPAMVLILSSSLETAGENLQQSRRISVFLQPEFPGSSDQLASTLQARPEITRATVLDSQALTRHLPQQSRSVAPLPGVLELTLASDVKTDTAIQINKELQTLPGIEFVAANGPFKKHPEAVRLTRTISAGVAIFALLLTSIIVFTLTKRDIRNHQHYLDIMNQHGATLVNVRRPFFVRNVLVGISGAFFGSLACSLALRYSPEFIDLSTIENILPDGLSVLQICSFMLISALTASLTIARTRKFNP